MAFVDSMGSAPHARLDAPPGSPGTDLATCCESPVDHTSSRSALRETCMSSGASSSPSPSPIACNIAEDITKMKLWELRLLCRLIGLHSRPSIAKGQRISIYLSNKGEGTEPVRGPSSFPFVKPIDVEERICCLGSNVGVKALGTVNIGANTKCMFFLNDEEDHLFICFNWFDPKNLVDVFSLTCRIASSFNLQTKSAMDTEGPDDGENRLKKIPFLDTTRNTALAFWYNEAFQGLLQDAGAVLRAGCVSAKGPPTREVPGANSFECSGSISVLQRITCTGFSIGGPTAFYMAALLASHVHPDSTLAMLGSRNVRAVAFGSPRFCGSEFIEWCGTHLAPSSCSVILYSPVEESGGPGQPSGISDQHHSKSASRLILDPVCVQGCGSDGFAVQPRPYLLKVGGGLMKMTSEHEREVVTAAAEVEVSSSNVMWNMATRLSPFTKKYDERYAMLHSVLHYYEALADTRV